MTPVPLEVAENWESAGAMTSSDPPRPTGLLRPLKGPSPRALVEQNAVNFLGWTFEAGVIPKLGVDSPSAL